MVGIEQCIECLTKARDEQQRAFLLRPRGKEAFDYGQAVGTVQGLQLALNTIADLLRDDARREALREAA